MKALFFLTLIYLMVASPRSALYAGDAWLAYGDIRGYIEPCGCDPKTDLGGVRRIAQIVQLERLNHKNLLVFDLGNVFVSSEKHNTENELKNKFLLSAIAGIRPSAILFNHLEDVNFAESDLLRKAANSLALPYVLSNPSEAIKKLNISKPYLALKEGLIFGYLEKTSVVSARTSHQDKQLFMEWNSIKEKFKDKPTFLLYSGSDKTLDYLLRNSAFSYVIRSNKNSFTHAAGKEERENEGLLKSRINSKDIYAVPLAGQGVLRGGVLRQQVALPLQQILAQVPLTPAKDKVPQETSIIPGLSGETVFSWLEPSFNEGAPLEELLKDYYKMQKSSFSKSQEERKAQLKDSPYLGAIVCQGCHEAAYKSWQKSKHHTALFTLQAKDKHEVLECVICHSLGADKKGGFVSLEKSPQFAHVQCESCHGPRKDHVKNPVKPKSKKTLLEFKPICETCHNPTHSPDFSFEVYWQRIKHGN